MCARFVKEADDFVSQQKMKDIELCRGFKTIISAPLREL